MIDHRLGERAVVVGSCDMLGRALVRQLVARGVTAVAVDAHDVELGSLERLHAEIRAARPSIVFHVPAARHGFAVHRIRPATICHEDLMRFSTVMDACRSAEVGTVVNVLYHCVYAPDAPVPLEVRDLWCGLPHADLVPYGLARRLSVVQAAAYRAEFGLRVISLILPGLYGAHDNFDAASAQVVASMIRRFVDAADSGAGSVVCWGSGAPTREFLHADDAATAIVRLAERFDKALPLNVGSGLEVSIRALAGIVAAAAGYEGEVIWEASHGDGRRRVCLDSSAAKSLLPEWSPRGLEEGVTETVAWYRSEVPRRLGPAEQRARSRRSTAIDT